ncbi:MAG: type VI secretion system tube protein Hcp [Pseudomonadales bacterium]|nr:type VI secretion system tube protein Hcp [Pseudomonadales bacterium]
MKLNNLFSMAICLISLSFATTSFAAYEFYIKIEGSEQGLFTEATKEPHVDWINVLAVHIDSSITTDTTSGSASGKPQHEAITIAKEWDMSSPMIMKALRTNENLPFVEISAYKVDETGYRSHYYTIELTNATISSINSRSVGNKAVDKIGFNFERIEFSYE